jgi:signal transduction histidine kinase
MRLADFILANVEPILAAWEVFARSIGAGAKMDTLALRDHAEHILRATVRDMTSAQTAAEQSDKSTGHGASGTASTRLDGASEIHGVGRVGSGFDLAAVVAEYRALRASVIQLWRASVRDPHLSDVDDLVRFNESIDQSLTAAVLSYTRRVDQSRQMFLAILAHDLRNPLNSIMMSAAEVSHDGKADPDSTEAASRIAASAAAIAKMVTDLLDFAGTGVGAAMPLSPAAMDLLKLCQEVSDEFRAAHPGCKLKLDPNDDLTGTWDASRLRQVLSNLLGNAAQHGGSDCGVSLSAAARGDDVVLAVHNEGSPIPPDVLPTIFEPLVRVSSRDGPKQRRPGSIGLGLYIAREIVLAHGGTIDVTSSAQSGTTFTVRLPRRSSPAPR